MSVRLVLAFDASCGKCREIPAAVEQAGCGEFWIWDCDGMCQL